VGVAGLLVAPRRGVRQIQSAAL